MLWINLLHLYQPANADGHVIKEATEKSYLRLIEALEKNPQTKFTLNISSCLLERWRELNFLELIERLNKLIKAGQIEVMGSAAYHPFLPLTPEKETIKQIKEQEKKLKIFFGKDFKPNGFFLPEMTYSHEVGKLIKKLGYEWIVLDEIAYNGKLNQVDFDKVYQDSAGLKIVFRNRKLSKSYVPKTVKEFLTKETSKQQNLIITATDGELYGLRHKDLSGVFEKILKNENLETLTISEFIKTHKKKQKIKPKSCSWESLESELMQNKPYALWFDKKNKIQQKLWKLANLAYKTVERHNGDDNYGWARWHLVRGLASCTFWWASAKDFRLFGPISWSPDEIERGTNELIRSIRALEESSTRKTKIKAEKLYVKIKKMVWEKHWRYYWKK